MALVGIIIPFYKAADKLRTCLAAIAAQEGVRCETFVRDNSEDNIYYTAAVNEGLARFCWQGDVPYVLVLNQDAYMAPDCVHRLVEFMDAHPDCGIATPVQFARDGGREIVTWAGGLRAFPAGQHHMAPVQPGDAPFETPWANGACMMIRSATVRECGLLDRNMRFICSDSDFSFTARARGWKAFVVPRARCEHALGESASSDSVRLQAIKCADALYFGEKWLSGGLYRQLAVEGPELSVLQVRDWIARLRSNVQALQQRIDAGGE